MPPEHYNGYKDPIYDPKRAIPVGIVSIDPKTGWGMRLDNQKKFQLGPKQITLLRILDDIDPDVWKPNREIAAQYELIEELDSAFKQSLSYKEDPKRARSQKKSAEETLERIYGYDQNPEPIPYDIKVTMAIRNLRKKIGTDAIESRSWGGYRLARPPNDETLIEPQA